MPSFKEDVSKSRRNGDSAAFRDSFFPTRLQTHPVPEQSRPGSLRFRASHSPEVSRSGSSRRQFGLHPRCCRQWPLHGILPSPWRETNITTRFTFFFVCSLGPKPSGQTLQEDKPVFIGDQQATRFISSTSFTSKDELWNSSVHFQTHLQQNLGSAEQMTHNKTPTNTKQEFQELITWGVEMAGTDDTISSSVVTGQTRTSCHRVGPLSTV